MPRVDLSPWLRSLFLQSQLSTTSHRCIITDEHIESVLTWDRVRALLGDEAQLEPHLLEQYTALAVKRAKKILFILVFIGRVGPFLEHFLHRQIWDERLPLNALDLPKSFAALFLQEQWRFLAPTIERGTFYDWPSDVILPFELDEPLPNAEGSFGLVSRIAIVPEYQKLQERLSDMETKVSCPS